MSTTPDPLELKAEFVVDHHGTPEAISAGGKMHYRIKLNVKDAPAGAYAVVYRLHPTYLDPTREVLKHEKGFELEITSYGDYVIQSEILTRQNSQLRSVCLSDALKKAYPEGMRTSAIQDALRKIESE